MFATRIDCYRYGRNNRISNNNVNNIKNDNVTINSEKPSVCIRNKRVVMIINTQVVLTPDVLHQIDKFIPTILFLVFQIINSDLALT